MPTGAESLDVRVFPVRLSEKFAYSPRLGQELKSHAKNYDVIHMHSLFQFPQLAAFRVAQASRIPYVVSPRGALDPHMRIRGKLRKKIVDVIWQRRMLDRAACLHFTSPDEKQLVTDLQFASRTEVIPNGLDLARFTFPVSAEYVSQLRADLKLNGSPIIINHGRVTPKKGLPLLIDAMLLLRQRFPNAKLVLVGPDSRGHLSELKQYATARGLNDSIVCLGLRTGEELKALISMGDVWALPSYSENFGNAVVEALAMGIPTITTKHVNIAGQAKEEGALLISEQTPEAFANALISVLDDTSLQQTLRVNGLQFAKRYDWMDVGQRFLELYGTLINQARSPS